MKPLLSLFLAVLMIDLCRADDRWESDFPILSGQYEVIGRHFESDDLFQGTVTIEEVSPNQFGVKRCIAGKTIEGRGTVDYATSDKIPVFRIYFTEGSLEMEGVFLWHGDLDNSGRLSGYVFKKGYNGKKVGLETFFAHRNGEN